MSLTTLAPETLEEIASHIECHRDLISLALVSSAWKARIIPRHSQYRVIRICEDMPHLWAHLAKRSDLARTLTAVHICEGFDFSSPQIYPTAFLNKVPETGTPHEIEERKFKNMCQALRNMTRLKEFAWSLNYSSFPTTSVVQENAIFSALTQCKSLAHLALWGRFAERAPGADRDPSGTVYAVSSFSFLVFNTQDKLALKALEHFKFGNFDDQRTCLGQASEYAQHLCHAETFAPVAGNSSALPVKSWLNSWYRRASHFLWNSPHLPTATSLVCGNCRCTYSVARRLK